jgi:phosphatidylserine/phosphatidylglycerophosphate/cardiolipin synthase-like enzyme
VTTGNGIGNHVTSARLCNHRHLALPEQGEVMADPQRPDWLDELIGVVGRLCPEPGKDAPESTARKSRNLGRVSSDTELGAGWFWIGLAGQALEGDQLEAAFLAPSEGAQQHKFQLIETIQVGNVLKVRVAKHAPGQGLFLWVPARPVGLLERSLLNGLSSIDRFTLVNHFAEGRADAIPGNLVSSNMADLNAGQQRALTACCSPGLQLVWGPPGTGKTKVIAQSLQHLIASGKSALLVSMTRIAVDNALAKAAAAIKPAPGVMIRAGNPDLTEIAQNSAVCLQKLVHDRQEALEQERRRLEEDIATLKADPAIVGIAHVKAELEGFDISAYRIAEARLARAELLSAREAELVEVRRLESDAALALADLDDRFRLVLAEHAVAETARQCIADAFGCQRMLDDLKLAVGRAEIAISKLENERDHLAAELSAARARRRFGHHHLKTLIQENAQHLAGAISRRNEGVERLGDLAPQLAKRVETDLRAALPNTPESLADLDRRLADSRDRAREAKAARDLRAGRTRELTTEVAHLMQGPRPTDADSELVSDARARDLLCKAAELPNLEMRAAGIQRDIDRLESEHERVVSRMQSESSQVRRQIVRDARVVATTLAMLRMSPELREREYDFVIVDEVSAACPPEVVYAASRALEGVTLLGDFLQNGPIVPDEFRESADNTILRWYGQDSFALFGIRDATSAQNNPGCATLFEQYRFGPVINELANAVAYRGLLRAAGPGPVSVDDGEIVLVDVDGLGDELAAIRRKPSGGVAGWWPIGVLLARALAEQRVRQAEEEGESASMKAGVLAPYRDQQQLVQDILNESGASPQIEVGTSHRFQGREFDTVIFDLVEDGRGWIAQGDLKGTKWQADGLRLFNVGITRARRRLYLIANVATIYRARSGPLHALGQLLDAEKIQVVRASEVLGLRDAPEGDQVVSEIWHALRGHARLIDLFDEDHLPDELCRRIDAAQERIWLWSPWVGRRSEQLLPHLSAAQDRGVRVHPVVLPRDEVTMHLRSRHEELAAQIAGTVYLGKEHQKIVIIDRSLTFIGSMNILAHVPGGRLEVMALFESPMLADRLLEHERADQLRQPPICARCGAPVRQVRVFSDRGERRLYWLCVAETDGDKCGWRQPFPDQRGTRNQPRRTRNDRTT